MKIAEMEQKFPEVVKCLLGEDADPREALQGHAGYGIYRRAWKALYAADT